jgi:8-amino-7-oxononanoate synthase
VAVDQAAAGTEPVVVERSSLSPMHRLDFASSLYLGIRHPSSTVPAYASLSTGAPAAMRAPAGARSLASELAGLIGCQAATLATSTLHIFLDLFSILAKRGMAIIGAGEIYPIARWGIERAAAKSAPAVAVSHSDPRSVRRRVSRLARLGSPPILVSDGLSVSRGALAPLSEYLCIARDHGGLLVVDDTQALGVLGEAPLPNNPYGHGGGGSLRSHGICGPDIVAVSSLAKGFGVPVAILAGSRSLVQTFEAASETRVHCSPPNSAVIAAGLRALAINRSVGDRLRDRLLRNVLHFRRRLREIGLCADGALFPVQTLRHRSPISHVALNRRLAAQGVRTLLLQPEREAAPRVVFILTARHRLCDIDRAVAAVDRCLVPDAQRVRRPTSGAGHIPYLVPPPAASGSSNRSFDGNYRRARAGADLA